jgi:hypothetical protein
MQALGMVDESEELERIFAEHGALFVERVRAFYGARLRADADRIAFELLRLELAALERGDGVGVAIGIEIGAGAGADTRGR